MKAEIIGIAAATVVVVALVIWGVMTLDGQNNKVSEDTTINQGQMEQIVQPSGDLKIETLAEGKGEVLTQKGDIVTVHYRGTLTNGQEFDASIGKQPFTFQLGAGQVIKGWDQGLEGMKVGEKRRLTIPSDMAYGAQEIPGRIPANSTLVFEVELIKIGE